MTSEIRQLNPFEIKAEITTLISEFKDVNDLSKFLDNIKLLDAQNDKKTIAKILFKELYNLKTDDGTILCFLLERYADKEELVKKLWDLLKNNMVANNVKIVAINFLRGLDSNWELDSGDELLNEEIIDAETKKLLNNAIINPEVQIDFLDFLTSLSANDKITLINSMGNDYSQDALANILIPVFLSQPDSEVGKEALKILGESKSQLAFHALNSSLDFVSEEIKPLIKKSLSTLKIAGIREDNSEKFYKEILSESVPYKFCATYPDGHGNQALIFTRKTSESKIRFVAIVIDDYHGIRDCFGFNEISLFECEKIIERFYKNEKELILSPEAFKTILINAEKISKANSNNWLLPYEYICWKNLLSDIDFKNKSFEEILSTQFKRRKLTETDLDTIYSCSFMNKWFLNPNYSDEFEELCNIRTDNLENAIVSCVDKVFYEQERRVWTDRLLSVAYLEYQEENFEIASILYNLYYDET
ncbi:hypothetical protein IJZ97_03415, partial [bacterium]|nr:hypothetical protein [bacterium]